MPQRIDDKPYVTPRVSKGSSAYEGRESERTAAPVTAPPTPKASLMCNVALGKTCFVRRFLSKPLQRGRCQLADAE